MNPTIGNKFDQNNLLDFWHRLRYNHLWKSFSLLSVEDDSEDMNAVSAGQTSPVVELPTLMHGAMSNGTGMLISMTLITIMAVGIGVFHVNQTMAYSWNSYTFEAWKMKIFWGLAFCLSSVLMTFANKVAVQGSPVLMAALQMAFTIVFLLSLGPNALGLTTLGDWKSLLPWLPVPIFFVSMIVSSLLGLSHETITTCVLFGSLRPLYAIPMEMRFLGERLGPMQVFGCAMLLLGSVVYVGGMMIMKARLTGVGIMILVFNGLAAAVDRCWQRYLLHHDPIKASKLALMLTSNSMGLLMILVLLRPLWIDEVPLISARLANWVSGKDWTDLSAVLISCIGGVSIGYTGLGFQKTVTASAFLAVTTGVRALMCMMDALLIGTETSVLGHIGLLVVIGGSVACAAEDIAKRTTEGK